MRFTVSLCAAGLVALLSQGAEAALLKAAGSTTTTSAVKTTTSGQRTITCTIDPANVQAFQLDFQYDADKVALLSVTGVNGYVVSSFTNDPLWCSGSYEGVVKDITGYFDGPVAPAAGVDMVELVFLDLDETRDKGFRTFFANDDDFLQGSDLDSGLPITLTGSQLFSAQSFAHVDGEIGPMTNGPANGPGPAVPLPAGAAGGVVVGAVALFRERRRTR
jgi:hypothetical protein